LILIHELGHFFLARRSDVRVETFSIGFGPTFAKFKRGETEYKLAPFPLGGYVKMTGEDPDEEGVKDDPRSFANKSVWTKIKIVAAGPITNVIFAFILMPIVFMIGRMEPAYLSEAPVLMGVKGDSSAYTAGLREGDLIRTVNGKKVETWNELQKQIVISVGQVLNLGFEREGRELNADVKVESMPEFKAGYIGVEPNFFIGNSAVVDQVTANGPAAKAGMEKGDKIVAISGVKVDGWMEMAKMIHESNGNELNVTIERGEKSLDLKVLPEFNKDAQRWVIGVVKGLKSSEMPMKKRRYGFIGSIKEGTAECANLLGLTFKVLERLFTGQLSYKSLGGPIQIAQASMAAAKYGIAEFIYFVAFLSIQLGILNLLPIPVLDGGHILFCGIEGVIRRQIPTRIRSIAQYIGLILILGLMLLVTLNDVDSVWGIKKLLFKIIGK
jgi:regulator of sigma E protease